MRPCQATAVGNLGLHPGVNDHKLSDVLVEERPEILTLFTSGYADSIIAVHGVIEPGTDFLQKPYQPPDLLAKIREILDRPASQTGDI